MSKTFKIKDNIIYAFTFRSILAIVLLSTISSLAIYFYKTYDFYEMLSSNIKQEIVDTAKYFHDISKIDNQVKRDVKSFMEQSGVSYIELYDNKLHQLFSLESTKNNTLKVNQIIKHNPDLFRSQFPNNVIDIDDTVFEIIETQEDDIFLLVMYPIILEEELLGYIKAISLLDAHIFAIYKKNIYETIVIVNLTIILLVLLLFPIVNKAYRELNERKTALLESNIMMLTTLGDAIALRDSDTNAHNYRVTLYTIKLGQTIGLNNNEMKTLIKGAFLHDIGKIGIQDRILLKPDKLSADEFKLMKEHVIMGSHMVLQNSWLKDANDIILFHHEKYDGSGYPNGFKKDAIPKLARLFTIVDVFDALTSIRPYKNSYSYEESIALLKKGSGTQFDPYYLNQFLSISKDLHQKVYHHSTEELRDILEQLSKQYFSIV